MDDMAEVIAEFLVESQENLDRLDEEFVLLEQDPSSKLTLAAIFRTIHTIKGTSGFLGFDRLERLTHQGENLLSLLRDGKRVLSEQMTTALLAMVDAVRSMLEAIAATGADGTVDYHELASTLAALASGDRVDAPGASANAEQKASAAHPALLAPAAAGNPSQDVSIGVDGDHDVVPGVDSALAVADAVSAIGSKLVDAAPAAEGKATKIDSSIRVEVGLLDHLMNLVGELVLARNQLLAHSTRIVDSGLSDSTQRLNFITTELQEGVMKTRMQPVSGVWSKFPRVVRDLSIACGKKIRLEMEGAETELDKTIIEAIKDPLTHIVRNSVDHGIETPEVRVARGKNAEGVLLLRAYHEGGQVIIEIRDDGGGIDPARIRAKAIEKGLLTPEAALKASDHDVIGLIFAPGFSTAEQVTNVSGRGVGMDVVKTNIERIGGSLDVQSVVGSGTTLVVKIPLTLAIIPALVVGLGDAHYAISQVNLVELVRIEASNLDQLERIGDASVYRLRGKLLPVIALGDVLGTTNRAEDSEVDSLTLVVLSADGRQFGVVVDEVRDTQEIVVKPLGSHLAGIDVYAGTTIMGDGSVALILDAPGLATRARVADDRHARAAEDVAAVADGDLRSEVQTLVVCEVGPRRFAVPIGLVDRLEEVSAADIELAAGREVVQYRGGLLSIIRLSDVFGVSSANLDPIPLLVHLDDGELVGLAVDRIIDIVDETAGVGRAWSGDYVDYSGVIGRRVTDLIDLRALVASTRPQAADLVSVGPWNEADLDTGDGFHVG